MAETFILYLYVCATAAHCQWAANGEFKQSKEIVVVERPTGVTYKGPKYSGLQMCEAAAKKLKVKAEDWQCISSGLHP